MSNLIKDFYSKLGDVPEIVELVQHHFNENAHPILDCMKSGQDLGDAADEVEGLITEFVATHATEVAVFQALGPTESSSTEAMDYFEKYHPDAYEMMLARTQELQKLLGKRNPLHRNSRGFRKRVFDNENQAVEFAKSSYAPFIENYEKN